MLRIQILVGSPHVCHDSFDVLARSGRNSFEPLGVQALPWEAATLSAAVGPRFFSRDRFRSLVGAILDCHWQHWCRVRFITMSQTGMLIQLTGEYISVVSYGSPRRGRSNERFCSWSSTVRRMPDRMKT
jgi:hypothetical protein